MLNPLGYDLPMTNTKHSVRVITTDNSEVSYLTGRTMVGGLPVTRTIRLARNYANTEGWIRLS